MDGLRELGATVRRLRTEAGLSGAELARRAGVPQPSVSRVESGRRLADGEAVARLLSALVTQEDARAEELAKARDAYAGPAARRVDAGVSLVGGQVRRRMAACGMVRSFSCAMVPAVLRTAAYAEAVAAGGSGRPGNLAGLIDDMSRSFAVLVTEGALRTWPDDVPMGEQLDWIGGLAARPNVRLGVLPWGGAPSGLLCDFTLLGDDAVWVETFTVELTLSRADDVARYAAAYAALEGAAVFGSSASAVIAGVAADFGSRL